MPNSLLASEESPTKDVPPGLESCSDSFSITSERSSSSTRTPLGSQKFDDDIMNDEVIDEENEQYAEQQEQGNYYDHPAVSFSVQGIYTKWYPTEKQEESKQREFVICRRRMNIKPIDGYISDRHPPLSKPYWTDPSNGDDEEEDDDDDEEWEEIPVDEEGNEVAMFVPKKGLIGGDFWHVYDEEKKTIREDRAILFQSQENYNRIIANERFKTCFDGIDYMESATFGEQVIVNGIETSQLAIGDVFVIEEDHSPLVIEITAPRKPCSYINTKHGTKFGTVGLQHYAHQNCLAGWFARVLVAGELKDGMKFTRNAHPNPKWTLPNIYKALYWEGNYRESLMNKSSWNRSRNELEELISLPQLGECEWKADGRALLMKMDGIDLKTVRADLIDPQIDPKKSKKWHTDPDLLTDSVSNNTHIFFIEYLCMTELYQSMNELLKFLGITTN